jgi:hypothetical protein
MNDAGEVLLTIYESIDKVAQVCGGAGGDRNRTAIAHSIRMRLLCAEPLVGPLLTHWALPPAGTAGAQLHGCPVRPACV